MKDLIALQHGLVIPPKGRFNNRQMAGVVQAELMRGGFSLNEAAFKAVSSAPEDWIKSYYENVVAYIHKKFGNDRSYSAFYPNFPTSVMEANYFDLFLNAMMHYWIGGDWSPVQEIKSRGMAFEKIVFKNISLGTESDFVKIFERLVTANQSITEDDKEAIKWFLKNQPKLKVPSSIPFKETLCLLAANGADVSLKTPTDVLRVAVYMSGGDISLPALPKMPSVHDLACVGWRRKALIESVQTERDTFKFKKFSRPERRLLLGLLEAANPNAEEMKLRSGRWTRLGEILHVGEYAERYPKSFAAFKAIRDQDPTVRTFYSKVEDAFSKDWKKGVKLLESRPGEFVRKIDWMVRKFDPKVVLKSFSGNVSLKASGKVLIELYNHFVSRTVPGQARKIILKGRRSRIKELPPLPTLSNDVVEGVKKIVREALSRRVEKLPSLGTIWIDERLRNVPLPSAMRSANSSIRTYVRGTRIPFREDAKVIRAFLHWFDEEGSIDLDLAGDFRDENGQSKKIISYFNLRDIEYNCCHSGDIRHRQGACAEYIDVDVERCLSQGIRYVLIEAYNFNGKPMHDVKDAVFGIMEREHPAANEIFVPSTIADCMGVANESSAVLGFVLDLKEKCYIWADQELTKQRFSSAGGLSPVMLKTLVSKSRFSVYDLLEIHAKARGKLTQNAAKAELSFKWEDMVTDYAKALEYANIPQG